MGIQSSMDTQIKNRHMKFMKVFRSNYKLKQQLNDQIFGACSLYQNTNTGEVEVLEKILSFQNQVDVQKAIRTMDMRITKSHPNLLYIYDIQHLDQKELCGSYKSARVYTQYLQKNLKAQLTKRRKNGSFLTQELLLKITVSLLNGISYLHQQNTFHGEMRTQNVLVDNSYHLKIVQRSLLSPSNWEVVITHNMPYKILKGKGVLLSPCIMQCLKQRATQMADYDAFKADIFAIGMIVLECCSLKKSQDLYDYENLKVKQQQITRLINSCRQKYSYRLINLVQKMLQIQDHERPTAKQLMDQMHAISSDTIRQMNTTLNESFLSQTIRSYL